MFFQNVEVITRRRIPQHPHNHCHYNFNSLLTYKY
jgi:hypothetical protein